jgi:hypothetical protein
LIHGARAALPYVAERDTVRAAAARNWEIRKPWGVISIADMLPAPQINDMLHRVMFAMLWESPRNQVLGRVV